MVNTVIFDLSEVLLTGLLGVENDLGKILNKDSKEVYEVLHNDSLGDLFVGAISEEEYLRQTVEIGQWRTSVGELHEQIRLNFEEISGTRYIIERCKKKGVKLGLLSVHAKDWIVFCES